MSRPSKDKMRLTAELIRHGGTILKESCPTCGGIQIRYRGKNYCTSHDDLTVAFGAEEISFDAISSATRDLVVTKIKEITEALKNEKDLGKQDQLVSLLAKYVDLVQKIPEKK